MEEPSPKGCYVTWAKVLPDLGATHSPLCTCTQSEPGATSGPKASSCRIALVPVNKNREAAAKLSVGNGAQSMRIPTSRANPMTESVQLLNSAGDCMPCSRHCALASLCVVYPSTETQPHQISSLQWCSCPVLYSACLTFWGTKPFLLKSCSSLVPPQLN